MTKPIAPPPSALVAPDAARLRRAARELEGVFLGMMFEQMAKGVDRENGLFASTPGSELYESMFRQEVAKAWALQGGVGLGDAIADSLRGRVGPEGPGRWPVSGAVTSPFGMRKDPISGAFTLHAGVDIAVPEGTPATPAFAGTVEEIGEDEELGRFVRVAHPGGLVSTYGHLSAVEVAPGADVTLDTVLGRTGATGRVTGPHLHLALRRDGRPVDPLRWLPEAGSPSAR